MLDTAKFIDVLIDKDISFYTGVPDSLLKNFCSYISNHSEPKHHVTAANEGNAIAIAAGHFLSTGNPALVYMQNSGMGNAVNPLISLADPEVFGIPLLLLIGWRGEPGIHDEPQHIKQGELTIPILQALGIPYSILPESQDEMINCIDDAITFMKSELCPYALVVRKGTFSSQVLNETDSCNYEISRDDAIRIIADSLTPNDVIVSTTGKISRELYEIRNAMPNNRMGQDFLTIGSMGHASQIALGIALAHPEKMVYCLDGDGALIMHMGALAVIGGQNPENLKHIVLNNGAHDSVGGQPTVGFEIDIPEIARACGYSWVVSVANEGDLKARIDTLQKVKGSALLEIRVRKGSRTDLGRPDLTPRENKEKFMEFIK